jgi:cell division protein FtsW (lipid II flippase)
MKLKIINLVLLIPIVNVLANVTTNYFESASMNPGFFRMVYFLFIFSVFVFLFKSKKKYLTIIIFTFLLYNLFLVFLNDNIETPIINYTKLALPLTLIPIGYTFIDSGDKLFRLFKSYNIALAILVLNYFISNIFKIGSSSYIEDTFYTGGAGAGLTAEISGFVIICITYLIINSKSKKKESLFLLVLIVISLIIILLAMRRGAILILGVGTITLFYFSNLKRKLFLRLLLIGFIMLFLYPFYGDILSTRYNYRKESRGGSIANVEVEARFLEIGWVFEEINNQGVGRALWGTHNLNSAEYFGKTRNLPRELHVGYMAIIHGSGILGLLIFFAVIISLKNNEKKLYKVNENNSVSVLLHALYLSLIVALVIYLFSYRLHNFGLTVPFFLMIGGILGWRQGMLNQRIRINNQENVTS